MTLKQALTGIRNFGASLFGADSILLKLIEVALGVVVADLVNQLFSGIKGLPASKAIGNLDVQQETFIEEMGAIASLGGINTDAAQDLIEVYQQVSPLDPIFPLLFTAAYTTQRLKVITDAVSGQVYQIYNQKYRPTPAPPNSIIAGLTPDGPNADSVREALSRSGISESDLDLIQQVQQRPLNEDAIIALLNLGQLDWGSAQEELVKLGYSSDNASKLLDAVPDTADLATLIGMAQSGVFSEANAALFESDTDRPEVFDALVTKLGYNTETAKYAWRMKYNMPPLALFQQAVHAGLLDQDQRDIYYQAIGIPPGLWDIMDQTINIPMSIPYAVQAFQANVINESTFREIIVKNGAGQTEEDIIVKLAKAQNQPTMNAAAMQQIMYALADGFIDDTTATTMFQQAGLTLAQAELQVILSHYQQEYEYNQTVITQIKDSFIKGVIDEPTAQTDLIHIGILAQAAQSYITKWKISKSVTEKIPTVSQYEQFYKDKSIGITELIDGIVRNGYNTQDATYIAANVVGSLSEVQSAQSG